MGNPPDLYYKILNLPKDSTHEEIRKAYKILVRKWHPDKHPPSSKSEAESRFKAITEAYEALSDQQENRSLLFQQMVTGEITKPSKKTDRIFGSMTDGTHSSGNVGGGVRRAFPSFSKSILRKPPPVERKLECTLEELCSGCSKEVKFARDVVTKNGLIAKKEESLTIKVKPGWKKGMKVTFQGLGDEKPGCMPADVTFYISERKHATFKRSGNDLVLKAEVPLVNALTGWHFSFRMINGETMNLSFHDEVIYPGFEKVLKGHGMPLVSEKGKKGDLRVQFSVVFPKRMTEEQRSGVVEILKVCE